MSDGVDWGRRRAIRRRRVAQLCIAVGFSAGTYALIYGASILYSLTMLFSFGDTDVGGEFEVTTQIAQQTTVFTVIVVLVLLAALRVCRRWWPGIGSGPWSPQCVPVATVLGSVGFVMASVVFGVIVIVPAIDGLHLFSSGTAMDSGLAASLWWAVGAGFGEEIIVLAVPVVILRFYRVPTVGAIWILVALRIAYHLYYNVIGVWWMLPWALASALIYWWWPDRRILGGLIVAHIAYDAVAASGTTAFFVFAGVAVILLAAATLADPGWFRVSALPMRSTDIRRALLGPSGTGWTPSGHRRARND
ncbi:hypothetical protein ABLE94_19260 [Gordonia sp. VNK1]|uniref:hypothetical protein n=1 Tax=Gordonia oleivorans TaxID=3156618 RepID=UPI0032B627AC